MRRHTSKRWRVLPAELEIEDLLQRELGLHPVTARLLAQRGITTPAQADAFLNPNLDQMHDPFLLPDAEIACERLKTALANQEKILVHGDYDGDGVTSAALWTRFLRSLGGDVEAFVPHRKRDGYDMRVKIIDQARAQGVTLIVTTDCGIQRVREVEHAREVGIDVIITDHHMPSASGELPRAIAVVNPQRRDVAVPYPFTGLAGVGVAFKMGEALARHLGHKPAQFRRGYLDLAAIGTVTDVMPLVDENRLLVKFGLDALQTTKKPGLRALIEAAGYADRPLTARDIGFGIGPRLNAASRIDETQIALDLLLTKDEDEARSLARRLNELNAQRQEEQGRLVEEAIEQVARQDVTEARCLVVSGQGWPAGLVGLVAGRIADRFNRPCVAIALDEATGSGRGSARSIPAFNILEAINACGGLLQEYGGHAHAAGLKIVGENVEDFTAQMNRLAGSMLSEEDFVPSLDVAMELDPSEICPNLLYELQALAPFGNANPEPCFVSRSVPVVQITRMGGEKQHLRLSLRVDGLNGNNTVAAPWWRHGDLAEGLQEGGTLDLCYKPQFNDWNNRRYIQFMLEDIQAPEAW